LLLLVCAVSAGKVTRPSTSSPQNLCATATWNQKGITIAGGNEQGSALNQLDTPTDIALDSNGNLYIADGGNNRILKITKNTRKVTTLISDVYTLYLFFDKSYTYLYYTDPTYKRVQKLNIKSGQQTTVAGIVSKGNANQLSTPSGLYVDSHGALYVADANFDDVLKFKAGSQTGVLVANQLSHPGGLFVDETDKNYLYICDVYNRRVVRWSSDRITATTVADSFGSFTSTYGYAGPRSVIVDPTGKQLYISDQGENRIVRWPLKDGKNGQVVIQPTGVYTLNAPYGIKFDVSNNLYVADSGNHRVVKFLFNKASCRTQSG